MAGADARRRAIRSRASWCSQSPISAASSCWRSCSAGTGVESLYVIAALALLVLAGLIEAAMPALRAHRAPSSLEEPWIARIARRMAEEPRRTRLAAVMLRALVLAAL